MLVTTPRNTIIQEKIGFSKRICMKYRSTNVPLTVAIKTAVKTVTCFNSK